MFALLIGRSIETISRTVCHAYGDYSSSVRAGVFRRFLTYTRLGVAQCLLLSNVSASGLP